MEWTKPKTEKEEGPGFPLTRNTNFDLKYGGILHLEMFPFLHGHHDTFLHSPHMHAPHMHAQK